MEEKQPTESKEKDSHNSIHLILAVKQNEPSGSDQETTTNKNIQCNSNYFTETTTKTSSTTKVKCKSYSEICRGRCETKNIQQEFSNKSQELDSFLQKQISQEPLNELLQSPPAQQTDQQQPEPNWPYQDGYVQKVVEKIQNKAESSQATLPHRKQQTPPHSEQLTQSSFKQSPPKPVNEPTSEKRGCEQQQKHENEPMSQQSENEPSQPPVNELLLPPPQIQPVKGECSQLYPDLSECNRIHNLGINNINQILDMDNSHEPDNEQPQPPQQPEHQQLKPPPVNPWDPLYRLDCVRKEVDELQTRVESFRGSSRADKEYICLDELLTKKMIKLDDIDTEGKDEVRDVRRNTIKRILKCISDLENKVPLPSNVKKDLATDVDPDTRSKKQEEPVSVPQDVATSDKTSSNKPSEAEHQNQEIHTPIDNTALLTEETKDLGKEVDQATNSYSQQEEAVSVSEGEAISVETSSDKPLEAEHQNSEIYTLVENKATITEEKKYSAKAVDQDISSHSQQEQAGSVSQGDAISVETSSDKPFEAEYHNPEKNTPVGNKEETIDFDMEVDQVTSSDTQQEGAVSILQSEATLVKTSEYQTTETCTPVCNKAQSTEEMTDSAMEVDHDISSDSQQQKSVSVPQGFSSVTSIENFSDKQLEADYQNAETHTPVDSEAPLTEEMTDSAMEVQQDTSSGSLQEVSVSVAQVEATLVKTGSDNPLENECRKFIVTHL